MASAPFEAHIRQASGLGIINLYGDIDGDAEEALEAAWAKAEGGNHRAILLDFTGVEYINSKGIALIVVLLARAQQSGHPLLACGLSDHYAEIFEITRLSDYIPVYDNAETAIAEVQAHHATEPDPHAAEAI
jgi:anti-anti-sigma factor